MRTRTRLLSLLLAVVHIAEFQFASLRLTSNINNLRSSCNDCLPSYLSRTLQCLEQGMVANYTTFLCVPVNRTGTCGEGEVLVIEDNYCGCPFTKCMQHKTKNGESCSQDLLPYNNECLPWDSPKPCMSIGSGRRLNDDIYGRVHCECSYKLGFIEFEGKCFHEFVQGPCWEGEQLVYPATCQVNSCLKGQVLWDDGECYDCDIGPSDCPNNMIDLRPKNTTSDSVDVDQDQTLSELLSVQCVGSGIRAGVFDGCLARDRTNGTCIKFTRQPKPKPRRSLRDILIGKFPILKAHLDPS